MRNIVLIVWCLLSEIFLTDCDQFLCVESDEKTFWQARDICQAHNLTLPVLETREEYQDFWNFMEQNNKDDLWLGLQWNYNGYYQWLNGNILGIQHWASNEPRPQIGQSCVYADAYGYKKWRTAPCSSDKYVICFYKGYGYGRPYNNEDTVANFSRADEICKDTGGRLPVIIIPADKNALLYSRNVYMYLDVWLGLKENDDQFEWITGEKLGFYYWYGNGVGGHVHAHHDNDQSCPYITMEATATEHFCCRNKTIETGDVGDLWSQNYFRLVERNAIPREQPLSQMIVRRGTQCSMACSRDVDCFKYTIDGTTCKIFGNVAYVVSQDGVRLFQKVKNW